MTSAGVAYAALGVTLLFLLWIGLQARSGAVDVDDYVTARATQDAGSLGLSFFASGLGAWVLFAPPEVGAFVGVAGIFGYTLAVMVPYAVFAVIGPRLRRVLPRGHGLTEFVKLRYGRGVHAYVIALSILYMFVFLIAELTAIGGVVTIVSGIDGRVAIVAVVVTTLAYTTAGGLRASLRTDGWQAWMILVLIGLATVAIMSDGGGVADLAETRLLEVGGTGVEVALTLIVAVLAANLFHQGYWQRIWAAADDRALIRGAGIGMLASLPVTLLAGGLGLLAVSRGLDVGSPPVPFFALLAAIPQWVAAVVLVLAVALVCSTVDTLENALASLVAIERPTLTLAGARLATVLLMLPAAAVAFEGFSVLRIFLVADLLCATAVPPVLLGLWRRATPSAALAGSLAGLVGAALPGGVSAATFPDAVPALGPFLGALGASAFVTVALSLAARRETRLEDLASGAPVMRGA